MNITISFRNMEHTEALDSMIQTKSQKFAKWVSPAADIKWVCWIENNEQICEVKVYDQHKDFFAKAESDDLYKSIDLVIHKIQNQLS